MGRHIVGKVRDFPLGEAKILDVAGRSIGVFHIKGAFYALRNRCPHQGAELCKGRITGTTLPSDPGEYLWGRDGEILRCPWHGWEFDIKTGRSVFDPFTCRVRAYEVTVEPDSAAAKSEEEDDQEWLDAETYPVTVEAGNVVVHI